MRNFTIAVLVLLALTSCKKKDNGTDLNDTPTESTTACSVQHSATMIGSDVTLLVYESYLTPTTVAPPGLMLRIQTVQKYGCSNYSIAVTQCLNGNQLTIRLDS